jgi:hypothetical protein
MPVIAGLVSGFFELVASYMVARVSLGVACAGAFLATAGAAFVAVKAAFYAVSAGLSVVAPPAAVAAVGHFLPSNLAACITAIILVDTIRVTYDYWKQTLGVAFHLAKG